MLTNLHTNLFALARSLPDIYIHINGTPLVRSQSSKYLGVTTDEDLKWSSHIKNVENVISRNIGLIRRAQYMLDSRCLLLLHNALVLPFLLPADMRNIIYVCIL